MRSFAYLMLAAGALVAAQNLTIEITYAVECTAKSKIGDTIDVLYNGTFTNGTLFDSSYDEKGVPNPFEFVLGAHEVIDGWDLGLNDMCVGDKRKLTIPPDYGYGNVTVGPIPAGSTLVFTTELVGNKGSSKKP